MKKIATQTFFILLCAIVMVSCSNDDGDFQLTGVNGRPSSIKSQNRGMGDIFFYYQGNQISSIKQTKGTISQFRYDNNELVSVDFSPEDKNIADGSGSISFKKEGNNKIIIESLAEPSSNKYRWELELNEDNIPIKITDKGIFSISGTSEDLSVAGEREYYGVFSYDPVTKSLKSQAIYSIKTGKIVAAYTYEYDSNIGAISKVDLPLWYYAYMVYRSRDSASAYDRLFFNYSNNIVKESIDSDNIAVKDVINYTYKYNKENAPILMKSDRPNTEDLSITY